MKYQTLPVGELQTNCYIVTDEETQMAAVIDPGSEGERIVEFLQSSGLELSMILLTHAHFDHIGGVETLLKAYPSASVYLHEKDLRLLKSAGENLSSVFGRPFVCMAEPLLLYGGEDVKLGKSSFRVLHTPGHSMGSVGYLCDGVLFAGDTLFYESIGRYDFGSFTDILSSVKELMKLPEDTKVLPGHGPETTIGHEKRFNPYI